MLNQFAADLKSPTESRSPRFGITAGWCSLRYPSDLSDAEWVLVAPMIPPARRGGRRRSVDVREVLNAIFYVLSTGCQWKAMPKELPPKSTAHFYFTLWDWDGMLGDCQDFRVSAGIMGEKESHYVPTRGAGDTG